MKKRILTLSAASMLLASVAFADTMTDSIVSQFQDLGYTRIEVKRGPNTIKVEATRPNGRKREMVVDRNTGEILDDETGRTRRLSDDSIDVEVKTTDRDYDDRYDDDDDRDDDSDDDDRDDDSYDDDDRDDDSDDDDDRDDDSDDDDDRDDDSDDDDDRDDDSDDDDDRDDDDDDDDDDD